MLAKLMRFYVPRRLACALADLGVFRDRLERALSDELVAAMGKAPRAR